MSFIEAMKDKRRASRQRNVFHRGDEGQKGGARVSEMSFIGMMKDKKGAFAGRNVLHRDDERQKRGARAVKCPSSEL
ncbi:hypothetical protein FO478_13940 [Heyndrickxia coagulans DSM 1 = ATCC 7050]|nr:hypothetical protein [Heyndrickxia coagulans DSM 1 = ATCC 7050]